MKPEARQKLIIWWALWLAMLTGVVMTYILLGGNPPATSDPMLRLATLPFFLSLLVRWVFLPRVDNAQKALPLFIVGLALAESCSFLGLFLFPTHKLQLFILAVLGILQFCPLFATRYYADDAGA